MITGVSLFKFALDFLTFKDGNPAWMEEFKKSETKTPVDPRRPTRKVKSSFSIQSYVNKYSNYIVAVVRSFVKVSLLPVLPGDTNTIIKDTYKPYIFQPKRAIVIVPPIPLTTVKFIKERLHVTVNDVVTSCLTGCFRKYCIAHGDPLFVNSSKSKSKGKKLQVRALLPYAFPRKASDLLRNLWCFVSVTLPVEETDTISRLKEVKKHMDVLKNSPEAAVQFGLQRQVNKFLDSDGTGQLALDTMSKHTCVFTNVKGPEEKVYLLGEEVVSFVPIVANLISQVSIVSYAGEMVLNFVVDDTIIKHPDDLGKFFLEELNELHLACKDFNGKIY